MDVNGVGVVAAGSAVKNEVSGDVVFGIGVPSEADAAGEGSLREQEKEKRGDNTAKGADHYG